MLDRFLALPTGEKVWLAIGLAGQLCFASRFIVQWISSEMKKKSHIPLAFWYFSLIGGLILLAYAIYRQDPVFILGYSLNSVIYVRNLMLIRGEQQAEASQG